MDKGVTYRVHWCKGIASSWDAAKLQKGQGGYKEGIFVLGEKNRQSKGLGLRLKAKA